MSKRTSHVAERQDPLRARYRTDAAAAWIRDGAETRIGQTRDAFHGEVVPNDADGRPWPFGIHRAVGGDHGLPNPGDLLSAALAACLHSTTCMLADRLQIPVVDLRVTVSEEVDVRGCLLVDPSVCTAFQHMHCEIHLRVPEGIQPAQLRLLMETAERCCVVMQTLKGGTDLRTHWEIEQDVNIRGSTERAVPSPESGGGT